MTKLAGPCLTHPDRHVWDFWYYHDATRDLFHVMYLNADRSLVPSDQHHFSSQVGYARTRDFKEIEWVDDAVLGANPQGWDNTSIWTGDLVRTAPGYMMFYTSRDQRLDDGMTQNIGAVHSVDLRHWERIADLRLKPDPQYYEEMAVAGETSTHAWRDPFVFSHNGVAYMLVAAKAKHLPNERKGSVGLLRAKTADLIEWETLPPLYAPGRFGEVEVPQIYMDRQGRLVLAFSSWARHDHGERAPNAGGFYSVLLGGLSGTSGTVPAPEVVVPEAEGIYACRAIPEREGVVVGFDVERGGLRRSATHTDWLTADRDFSGLGDNIGGSS